MFDDAQRRASSARSADRAVLTGAAGTVISLVDSLWPPRRCANRTAGDQRQEREVRVGDAQDAEAGPREVVAQLARGGSGGPRRRAPSGCRCSAFSAATLTISVRRAAAPDTSPSSASRSISSSKRVEHVERGHEVEVAAGKGRLRRRRARDLPLTARARVGEPAPGDVDAEGRPYRRSMRGCCRCRSRSRGSQRRRPPAALARAAAARNGGSRGTRSDRVRRARWLRAVGPSDRVEN